MSNFRMKGSPKRSTRLALQGVIGGGKLDGWRYTFQRFSCTNRGALLTHLVVNEPDWPFPETVALRSTQFRRLSPVAGERSPRIDALPLLKEALQGRAP